MFLVFRMKCPSEVTHQGGDTGFAIHLFDLRMFLPFLSYVHETACQGLQDAVNHDPYDCKGQLVFLIQRFHATFSHTGSIKALTA